MDKQTLDSIQNALENALFLISDEFESVQDEELKQKYVDVIAKLKIALSLINNK